MQHKLRSVQTYFPTLITSLNECVRRISRKRHISTRTRHWNEGDRDADVDADVLPLPLLFVSPLFTVLRHVLSPSAAVICLLTVSCALLMCLTMLPLPFILIDVTFTVFIHTMATICQCLFVCVTSLYLMKSINSYYFLLIQLTCLLLYVLFSIQHTLKRRWQCKSIWLPICHPGRRAEIAGQDAIWSM